MGALLYLGGCGFCGAAVAYLRNRGLPFVGADTRRLSSLTRVE